MTKNKLRYPRKFILHGLVIGLLSLLFLDALLWHSDPLGVVRLYYSLDAHYRLALPDPTGYRLLAGQHSLFHFTATILDDGSRLVPDSAITDCTIVAIGDSVTYGYGVNDDETWVNQLAQHLRGATWRNVGRHDYSAGNIALLKQHYPAAGYVWVLIYNDALIPAVYRQRLNLAYPASTLYLLWLLREPGTPRATDMDIFWQSVQSIAADNTLIIGIENDPLAQVVSERYPVVLIPAWSQNVSVVDKHPNATGHQQMAEAMLPAVTSFAERLCDQ